MSKAVCAFLGEPFERERALKEKICALESQEPLGQFVFEGNKVSLPQLQQALFSPSLFEPGRWVLVRRADELGDPKALLALLEPGLPPHVYLALDAEKLDKRGALFKWLKTHAEVQTFAPLDRRTLPGKLKALLQSKGLTLSVEAFQHVLSVVPPDLVHVGHEVEKMALYARSEPLDLAAVQSLLFGGQQANVFQFFDMLGGRNSQALGQLEQLLQGGEEAGKLFFMLTNHVRSLLLLKALEGEGLPPTEVAKRSALAPWMVQRRLQQARQWTQDELVAALQRLQEEDVAIKRGRRDVEAALSSVVLVWTGLL